jgi:hypothetical protein
MRDLATLCCVNPAARTSGDARCLHIFTSGMPMAGAACRRTLVKEAAMAEAIVDCDLCSRRIDGGEINGGEALVSDDRAVCGACAAGLSFNKDGRNGIEQGCIGYAGWGTAQRGRGRCDPVHPVHPCWASLTLGPIPKRRGSRAHPGPGPFRESQLAVLHEAGGTARRHREGAVRSPAPQVTVHTLSERP